MEEHRRAFDKIFEDKLNQIIKYNERQDKSIATLNKVMLGNGNPEKGYVVKHERLTEKVAGIISTLRVHWGLLSAILLALAGLALRTFL